MKKSKSSAILGTHLYFAIAVAVFATIALSSGAYAQVLEEIVVTARMRAESLQDVPLSISVVTSDDIESIGAYRMQDLTGIIPNVQIIEGTISNIISIRGIASGGNQGFEQSVGIFRDGIYTGRSQLSRLPFLDVEAIEVVRGPQGVLFGKSTIAGAIVQRSKNPTSDFEIGARTQLAVDENQDYEIEAFISGPLSENVSARLVGRLRESDGFTPNIAEGDNLPEREEYALRGTLQWDVNDKLRVMTRAEHSDWSDNGRPFEIYYVPPGSFYDGLIDGVLNGSTSITNSPNRAGPGGTDAGPFDDFAGFVGSDRERPHSDADAQLFTVKLEADIGEYSLEAITGYASYSFAAHIDGDFTAFPFITNLQSEEYDQFSQEIRLLSPTQGRANWIVGLYYETNEFEFDEQIDVVPLNAEKFVTDFEQEEDNLSLFGQLIYSFSDSWDATGGLRYTDTDKKATQSQILATILPIGNLDPITGFSLLGTVFDIANHVNVGSSSTDRVDWSFSLEHHMQGASKHTIYAAVGRGSKAGGFDARATQTIDQGMPGQLGSFEFLEETATSYELGLKSLWLDGRLKWNWALFYSDFEDLQESVFNGGLTFQVQNAPGVTTQGFETELNLQATENLRLWLNLGYVDMTFDTFPCSPLELAATPPGETCVSPRLGRDPTVPLWTGATGFRYHRSISARLNFLASATVTYRDGFFAELDRNINSAQASVTEVTIQLGFSAANDRWSIGLLGKNLTDELSCSNFSSVPNGGGALYCMGNAPRTVYLQASYNF